MLAVSLKNSSLDIIFGPMFSGKTTELLRRLNICASAGLKVLYINSILDTRCGDKCFSSHNDSTQASKLIEFKMTKNLKQIENEVNSYDVVGIDEAQFFTDLKDFVLEMVESKMKKVIVAGLNGDFERKPFGQINDLITFSDDVLKLHPFCFNCLKTTHLPHCVERALFSKRLSKEKETILIGSENFYIPVCRKCYLEND